MLQTSYVVEIRCAASLLGLDLLVRLDVLDVLVVRKAVDRALGVDGPAVKKCVSALLFNLENRGTMSYWKALMRVYSWPIWPP